MTDSEKETRSQEVAHWVANQARGSQELEPRILGAESIHRGGAHQTFGQATDEHVTALLFLKARDLNEAAAILETHPALRYRRRVELRPWTSPLAASEKTN